MTQLTLASVFNMKLFSRHYIEERLIGTDVWKKPVGLEETFKKITELYENEKNLVENYTEPQLEDNFIKPIFKLLNHDFEVQASVQRGYRRPDYAFFRNEKDRREAVKNKDTDDFYKRAIAVGDAKKWELELDKKSPSGSVERKFQNPSYQIYWYLEETPPEWGILTNGRKWRLYNVETARKLDTYYEVDLVNLIEKGNSEDFKYFYLFFRKEAFIPDSTGKCFLDHVLEESIFHAEKIGENLKENVYEALRILANGFFEWPRNNLEKNKEKIKKVHNNCLIFLYRLLFIFYAESQNMLPKNVPETYWVYDIELLIKEITDKIDRGVEISPVTNNYWGRLTSIFQLIDRGSKGQNIPEEKFKVPAYNGKLFDEEKHKFLRKNVIPDKHIAKVIDLLTRIYSEEYNKRVRVDYSDLSVRHLGSIYEGLLKYKLKVAEEDMAAIKQKGVLIWKKKSEIEGKKIYDKAQEGELYLITDKGERKATGSYYTPDYIVKYIVKSTLGPVLEEKLKNAKTDEEKREAILSTKVLDPAMGSGHFLVEATDFLAHKLVEVIESEETEQDIIKAKREVVKHCIYGVDINPLSTELAKLSLWLHTLAEDKPLSFLSHHLKTGNSLIGARLDRIAHHPEEEIEKEQKTLASFETDVQSIRDDIRRLIEMYREIMDMPENRPEDIHEAEEIYHEFREQKRRKRFNLLADVYTSYYFGNTFSKTRYGRLMDIFQSYRDVEWDNIIKEDWIHNVTDSLPDYIREEDRSIEKLSSEKKFFHWELEFPEVFFDIEKGDYKENPGFDAVIGNPPYIRAETADKEQRTYLMDSDYYETIWGRFDVYVPFLEKGIRLLRENGNFGMIVPGAVLTINYAEKLRKWILKTLNLLSVLDLRDIRVFKDSSVATCVLIIQSQAPSSSTQIDMLISDRNGNLRLRETVPQSLFLALPSLAIRPDLSPRDMQLKKLVDDKSMSMGQLCYCITGLVGHDSQTGASIDRLIHPSPIDETCEPYIEAKEWEGRYSGLEPRRFIEYKPELMHRPKFRELFESPKILVQRLASGDLIQATLDDERIYVNHVLNCCTKLEDVIHLGSRLNIDLMNLHPEPEYNLDYILALICSRLLGFYHNHYLSPGLDIFPETLRQLPIHRISFSTSINERETLAENLKSRYENSDFKKILAEIDEYLPKDKKGNFVADKEKSDVVHDFLAFLAEKMIEMNKEKNAEIKGFLKWLEIEVGTKIDDMSNKTAIKEYYNRDFETLISVLKKNKSKLQIDPSKRNFQEKVRAEFETSILKLKPLMAKIGKTDWLIDQIVYKLYRLTDEEIKIVEESVKK